MFRTRGVKGKGRFGAAALRVAVIFERLNNPGPRCMIGRIFDRMLAVA